VLSGVSGVLGIALSRECSFLGILLVGREGARVPQESNCPYTIFGLVTCDALGGVDLWDGNRWVHGLCERVLVEARVCSAREAFVVGVELYVENLLVVRAGYGNGGG
jgi:hypothetical protein